MLCNNHDAYSALPNTSNVTIIWTNIFKSALNKKVTFFNRPWIWFKADWFRADWIRYQRLHVEWSIVIKISEKHFVCPFISWKALKMGLSSIFPLRNQSALNQSVLNQIQGWLKIVTLLFKTDLKIFLLWKRNNRFKKNAPN